MLDETIELEMQEKGLTALRVTPSDIEASIKEEHYFTAAQAIAYNGGGPTVTVASDSSLNMLTFCVIVLHNGFTVTGQSTCVSPENYDAEIGRKIARDNAKQAIWPLLGYVMKDFLHSHRGIAATAMVDSVLAAIDDVGNKSND